MKKTVSLLLAFIIAVGAFLSTPIQLPGLVVSASAEETTAPVEGETSGGEVGEAIPAPEYELKFTLINSNREYAVSGYTGTPVDVVIPAEHEGKPVTAIADYAFHVCKTIKTLTIPNSIKTIGDSSFSNTTIEHINIEDNGLTHIGSNAFYSCSSLKSINFPNSLTTIYGFAFCGCSSLEKVVFPNSLIEINRYAFADCKSLLELTIPGSVKALEEYAFNGCSGLKSITFLDGVQGVSSAFENCVNLEKIDLPNTHVNLMASYFKGSKVYKDKNNWYGDSFYIDNQLINTTWYIHGTRTVRPGTTHINPGAFTNTQNLIAITIPASVKYIGDDVFNDSSVSIIYYEGTESQFNQIDWGNNATRLKNMVVVCGINKNNVPITPKVKSVINIAGGVQISWNKVSNAELYAVYRRGTSSTRWTLLGITTETSVIDTSASHRQYWRYSVQAINDNGASAFDYNGKYLKYVETPRLERLENHKDGIMLTWRFIHGASGYRVYRRAAGESWKYLGTVKSSEYSVSYIDKAVKNNNGKYYRYTVRAVVDGRYSGYEDYLYTMRLTAPKFKSCKYNNFKLTLKWDAAPSATGYDIYGYDIYQNYWEHIDSVKGGKTTSYTFRPEDDTRNYMKYSVVAKNGKYRSELNTTGIEP